MDAWMTWLTDRRVEIVFNPKPYERKSWLNQRQIAIAPSAYFLWGYDISADMNVLALRIGPRLTPNGIGGWALDLTFERRGPIWRWPRVRYNWAGAVAATSAYVSFLEKHHAEKVAKAA